MNNPFFVLTEGDEIIGIIWNKPLQPPPGEKEDPDFLRTRIDAAVRNHYDYVPSLITIPSEWREMHKPIPIIIDFIVDGKEEIKDLTLTMAWDY